MIAESRVKKTLLNARVNLIFYFLTLVLSFFSRKIFLDCLGADFVGLTGTLQNLLGFLNLAELGIGSAIGYLLYKPLYDHAENKINEIISVMGYLYRWIGLIILSAGCVLACFLPWIFPETGFSLSLIFFAYFAFLISSLIGYFINYRQNLLGADQKNFVVTAYFQTANIIKVIIQMALAYYTGNYYLWVAIEFIFGIIYSIILNWKINQTYPWLKADVKLGKKVFKLYPEVMIKTRQLFVHKISSFVQFQTTPFLIYSFVSLSVVAFYGNYMIILEKLKGLLNQVLGSSQAAIGNLCAEGNISKTLRIYRELFGLRFFISATVGLTSLFTITPFIHLWVGPQYDLPFFTVFLIIFITCISIQRGTTDHFIDANGLFQDTWAPVVESTIFLIVALIGGNFYGLNGILLGSIISQTIIVEIWKPYFLFKKGFNTSVKIYWKHFFIDFICIFVNSIVIYIGFHYFKPQFGSWPQWILNTSIIFVVIVILNYTLLYLFEPGIKTLTKRYIK